MEKWFRLRWKTENLLKMKHIILYLVEFRVEDYRRSDFRSGKRDRLEIVSAIIAITQHPSSLTRMMGYANLNYSSLTEYLRFMLGRHLIEKRDIVRGTKKSAQIYQATEKGNKFLELYCEGLVLLHGEHFFANNNNLAEAYLLQYCRKNKLPLGSKLHKSLDEKVESRRNVSAGETADGTDRSSLQ